MKPVRMHFEAYLPDKGEKGFDKMVADAKQLLVDSKDIVMPRTHSLLRKAIKNAAWAKRSYLRGKKPSFTWPASEMAWKYALRETTGRADIRVVFPEVYERHQMLVPRMHRCSKRVSRTCSCNKYHFTTSDERVAREEFNHWTTDRLRKEERLQRWGYERMINRLKVLRARRIKNAQRRRLESSIRNMTWWVTWYKFALLVRESDDELEKKRR